MSLRAYKFCVGFLVVVCVLFGWQWLTAFRQMASAAFIYSECKTTRNSFIEANFPDPEPLAQRLQFLIGYHDATSRALAGSPIAPLVEDDYRQTLTNAVATLRRLTTNDLGPDVGPWLEKYGIPR